VTDFKLHKPTAPSSTAYPVQPSGKLSSDTALQMLNQIGVAHQSEIRKAPERTLFGEIQAARLSSNTPLQFVDKATKGAIEWAMEKVRGVTSPEVDKSLMTSVRDTAWLGTYALTGDFFRPGDKQISSDVATSIEKYLDRRGKPQNFGEYDILSAHEWKPEGKIKINGEMKTLSKPIDNMLAVFVRNRDGSVEIIEPSQKMKSLFDIGSLGSFWDALTSTPKNEIDKRWQDTAGTHVLFQILPGFAGLGATAAGKAGMAAASKIPHMESILPIISNAAKRTGVAATSIGVVNATSGGATILGSFAQGLVISPDAIEKLADGLSNTLNASTKNLGDSIRSNLNNAFHSYSYKEGPMADKQTYIPSLNQNEQPWTRLYEALQGVVTAYQKPDHPWQPWAEKRIDAPEVKGVLRNHPGINHAFYSAVDKFMSGKTLTDQDIFTIRVGFATGPEGFLVDMNPIGQNTSIANLKYTDAERAETTQYIEEQLKLRLFEKAVNAYSDDPLVSKYERTLARVYTQKLGIDNMDDIDPGLRDFTPAHLRAFVKEELKASKAALGLTEKASLTPDKPASPSMAASLTP
jgi:hypothetical protein